MDEELRQKANQAAGPARQLMNAPNIPAKDGVVTLGVREAASRAMSGGDVTLMWDIDHNSEGVSAGRTVVIDAFLQSNDRRGKKLFGEEMWAKPDAFNAFLKSGDQKALPADLRDDAPFYHPANEQAAAILKQLERGQHTNGEKTQTIDYIPYDDRSRLYVSMEKQYTLLPELEALAKSDKAAFRKELDVRQVPERNGLMANKLHGQLGSGDYDTALVRVGAGHVEWTNDLDQLLKRDAKGRSYNVRNIAIMANPESPPGVFSGIPLTMRLEDRGQVVERTIADKPDLWINYLPNNTAEQFDERVQSRLMAARTDITQSLKKWRDQSGKVLDEFHDKVSLGKQPKALEELIGNYRGLRNQMAAWDFEGAQKSLDTMRKADFAEVQDDMKTLRGDVIAKGYIAALRSGLDEAQRSFDTITQRIADDKKQTQKPAVIKPSLTR